jgi:hypothetical protein
VDLVFFSSLLCACGGGKRHRDGESRISVRVSVCFCGGKGSPGSFLSVHDDGFLCGFLYFFFAMILAVFLKKDEEILCTEREREEEEEEETGKCVLVQTKPDLLLLRALSFFLVDERRHVGTTLDKRERLLLGITTCTASFFLSFFRSLFFSLVCLSFLSSCWNLFLSFGLWLFLPRFYVLYLSVFQASIASIIIFVKERLANIIGLLIQESSFQRWVGGRKEGKKESPLFRPWRSFLLLWYTWDAMYVCMDSSSLFLVRKTDRSVCMSVVPVTCCS